MNTSLSIITICFNNLNELITTCQSIDEQTQAPYEHWIIDGSSTPAIKEHLSTTIHPPYRKWISEPDKGIADAFNKGIRLSSGSLLNMLNAGDRYSTKNTLSLVAKTFNSHKELQWLHSKYQLQRGGQWVTIGKPFSPEKLYRGMRSLCHQTMFLKRHLHEQYGFYDTNLTIAMDYDFVCRIYKEKFIFLSETLVVMAPDGISNKQYLASLKQAKKVYTLHFGYSFKLNLWQARLKILHYLLSSRAGKFLYALKKKAGMENL